METARLHIRPFRPDDWPDLYAYLSLEEVVKYEPYGVFTEEACRQEALSRAQNSAFWAVCLKDSGKLIGNVYLAKQEFDTWELGFVFNKGYQGNGYATEAAFALVDDVFKNQHARRVTAQCNPLNRPSWKLLERLGMRREGYLIQNVYFKKDASGAPIWADTFEYGILSSEWLAFADENKPPWRNSEALGSSQARAKLFPIILSEYNPAWPAWFTEEKTNLEALIAAENIVRISHIGSTAVPGLLAKPTVDILLEIPHTMAAEQLIAALPSHEYIALYPPDMPTPPPHLTVIKGYTPAGFAERVFHIHVRCPKDGDDDWDELLFRDYLIVHPAAAAEYAALKRELSLRFEHDRDGYTEAKGAFIRAVTEQARRRSI